MATSVNLKQLIQGSVVLSDTEKKEWLDMLPFMNDKQQSELLLILQPQAEPSLSVAPSPNPSPISSAPPKIDEITAGNSLKPNSVPIAREQSPASKVGDMLSSSVPVTTVSAFLNKNFASELHRTPAPVAPVPQGTPIRPASSVPIASKLAETSSSSSINKSSGVAAQPILPSSPSPLPPVGVIQERKAANAVVTESPAAFKTSDLPVSAAAPREESVAPAVVEAMITVQSLEAVRMLNVTTLRGRGVVNIETDLKNLCEKFGYFSVQFAFEQSPLYQAYVSVGARILKDHQTFEEVQAALASAGRPYLTKPEFEEFSDLLRRMKGHG